MKSHAGEKGVVASLQYEATLGRSMGQGGGEEPGNEERGWEETCSLERGNLEDGLGEDCWPQFCWVGGLGEENIPLSPWLSERQHIVHCHLTPCTLPVSEGEDTLLIPAHTKHCRVDEEAY